MRWRRTRQTVIAVALLAASDPSLAAFEPQVIEVSLGSSGETIALRTTPDGGHTLDGEVFVPGSEVSASNGDVYVLTLSDGAWTATYQPAEQVVPLGTSGVLTLTKGEDGTWSSGEGLVADGATVVGSNGIPYQLTFVNGYWSARVRLEAVRIAGTPLFATPREDGRGYRVGTLALLPASGQGSVTVDGAMYHVWMQDGQLHGARYDSSPHGNTAGQANYQIGLTTGVASLLADSRKTIANEAGTFLRVGRGEFSLGELFDVNTASYRGKNFVQTAREEILDLRKDVKSVVEELTDDDLFVVRYLRRIWQLAQSSIDQVFGPRQVVLTPTTDAAEVLDALDVVLDALSTSMAFEAATNRDGSGVFKAADLDETEARNVFRARSLDSDVYFGVTGGTRYGAVRTKERSLAVGSQQEAELGAFAYSTIPDTLRTRDIPDIGSAEYEGETVAVSGDGEFHTGKIELLVRFRDTTVHGLIKDIKDQDGNPWTYRYGDVEYIAFPDAQLRNVADWRYSVDSREKAHIHYKDSFFLHPSSVESSFAGHLLGLKKDVAREAVGVWSIGSSSDDSNYLIGGFGATKVGSASAKPAPDEGEGSRTIVAPAGTAIENGILTLRGTAYGPNLTTMATQAEWDDEMPLLDAGRRIEEVHQVSLEQLISRQGSERSYSGRNLMGLARQEIGQLREQLVAFIALSDGTAVWRRERSRIWDQINERVQARLFGTADRALAGRDYLNDDSVAPDDPRKWSSGYPVSRGGTPDDDAALLAVDTILDALASPTALEAAIKEHSGGVFTRADGKPFRALAADTVEDVWRRSESRIKLQLGATDHTRFGAWRKQTAPHAWSDWSDRSEEDENGPNSFAYSPLPQSRLADLNLPGGGSATYRGETVAVQHSTFYKGSIELTAQWHEGIQYQHEVGLLTATISDVQNEFGDSLTYTIATGRETPIKELILRDISIQADIGSRLHFSDSRPAHTMLTLASLDAAVDLAADPSVAISFDGKFVGQLEDGLQGVIGTWTLLDGGDTRIGTGDTLYGAFGAELLP